MARPHKVSWHKSGRWYFTHTGPDGNRKSQYADPEIPKTTEGRRKATSWMEAKLKDLADRTVTGTDWTLDDLRLAFLTWNKRQVAKDEKAQHTYDGHRKHLNLLCAIPRGASTYGNLLARELTTKHVGELVKLWEGKSPTTIRNRLGSLQAMMNWAAAPRDDRPIERLIPSNPIAGYELPRAEYQGERYAPADEVRGFLAWLDRRALEATGKLARFERLIADLVRLAAETGCRPGEACTMRWEHFDAAQRVIVLRPKEHKTGRKTGRPRTILLTASLVAMVERIKANPDRHPQFIFTHECGHAADRTEEERLHGDPWNSNSLARRIRELRREAIAAKVLKDDTGLGRLHLYRLRHTRITNALQAGANIADVAALSGNSIQIIESTYLHHQIEHLKAVNDQLSGDGKIEPPKKPDGGLPPEDSQDRPQARPA